MINKRLLPLFLYLSNHVPHTKHIQPVLALYMQIFSHAYHPFSPNPQQIGDKVFLGYDYRVVCLYPFLPIALRKKLQEMDDA